MWPRERNPCRVYNDEKHESWGLLERDVSDTKEKRDSKKMEGFFHKDWIDVEKNHRTISIWMRCFILHSNLAVQVIITNKVFGWSVDNPGNGTKCQPGTFPCACVPLSYHIYSSLCGSWNTVDGTIPAPPAINGALWKTGWWYSPNQPVQDSFDQQYVPCVYHTIQRSKPLSHPIKLVGS